MFILGRKLKMTQIWNNDAVVPVTIVFALPNIVTTIRTKEKDGYEAIQLKEKTKKREFRISSGAVADWSVGSSVGVDSFKAGDIVHISSVSKGKGFQGVVKRHGFHGGPRTHGQKNRLRAPGSIGSTAPQRVVPGRRMAGRMGNDRVTVKGITVAAVDTKQHLLMLKGAIPGARGALVEIRKSIQNTK